MSQPLSVEEAWKDLAKIIPCQSSPGVGAPVKYRSAKHVGKDAANFLGTYCSFGNLIASKLLKSGSITGENTEDGL